MPAFNASEVAERINGDNAQEILKEHAGEEGEGQSAAVCDLLIALFKKGLNTPANIPHVIEWACKTVSDDAERLARCLGAFLDVEKNVDVLAAHLFNGNVGGKGSSIVKNKALLDRADLTCTSWFADVFKALMAHLGSESEKFKVRATAGNDEAVDQAAEGSRRSRTPNPHFAAMGELAGRLVANVRHEDKSFLSKYDFLFSHASMSGEFKTTKSGVIHVDKWGLFERTVLDFYVEDSGAFDSVLDKPYFTAERVEIMKLCADVDVRDLEILQEPRKRNNVINSLAPLGHIEGILRLVLDEIQRIEADKNSNPVLEVNNVYAKVHAATYGILNNYAECKHCDAGFVKAIVRAAAAKLHEFVRHRAQLFHAVGHLLVETAVLFSDRLDIIQAILSGSHVDAAFEDLDERAFTIQCDTFNELVNVISNLSRAESGGFNFDDVYLTLCKRYKSGPRDSNKRRASGDA